MKSWMKFSLVALLLSIAITSVALIAAPTETKREDSNEFLYKAGFRIVPQLTISGISTYWKEKYGLRFISDADMDSLCSLNGFIIGPTNRFLEGVPESAATTMMNNYKKIKDELLIYNVHTTEGKYIISRRNNIGLFSASEVYNDVVEDEDGEITSYGTNHFFDSYHNRPLSEFVKEGVLILRGIPDVESDWRIQKDLELAAIKVVAHHSKFDTEGMRINGNILEISPVKDPLAVIKHRGGWVVLAHWE